MAIRASTNSDDARLGSNPTGNFTVAFKFRTGADFAATYQTLFWMGSTVAADYNNGLWIGLGFPGDHLEVFMLSNSAPRITGATLAINTWYEGMLSGSTAQGGAITLWVNGATTLGGAGTAGASGNMGSNRLMFGNDSEPAAGALLRLEAGKVWNRALNVTEANAELNYLNPRSTTNLWGAWTLVDDGNGLLDTSGNGRNLTETGNLLVEAGFPSYLPEGAPVPVGLLAPRKTVVFRPRQRSYFI